MNSEATHISSSPSATILISSGLHTLLWCVLLRSKAVALSCSFAMFLPQEDLQKGHLHAYQ